MELRHLRQQAQKALKRECAFQALEARNICIGLLSQPGSGITYKLYLPRRTHTASKPGDSPAPDTGRLRGSITVKKINDFLYRVGTNVEYAADLEYGDMRREPRPFMRPTAEELRRRFRGQP